MVNKAILTGNVGRDPEIRVTKSGKRVASFTLATSERWNDKVSGEKVESTEWHRIVVWDGLVDMIEKHVGKGSRLYVEGQIKSRKFTDKNGVEKNSTEIVISVGKGVVELMGGPDYGRGDASQSSESEYDTQDRVGHSQTSRGSAGSRSGASKIESEVPF